MYPDYSGFAPIAYTQFAVMMLLVSAASGALICIVLKLRIRGAALAKDALLGAVGSMIAACALWYLGFQHNVQFNFSVAIAVAVALPVLHQFYRRKGGRTKIR